MDEKAEQTRQILRKVRQVEIHSRRYVTESLVGAYHSVFKGQGMDFEEVREYTAGDDVRSIDWNVTAKMNRPFVKLYREERELTIMLLVDLSASGDFGSVEVSKRELAAELASVIAFSATRNNDKVGLLLFTDKVEKFIYPAPCCLLNSQKKNGPPMIAVTTPTGISVGAITVRATVSQITRKLPPNNTVAGRSR